MSATKTKSLRPQIESPPADDSQNMRSTTPAAENPPKKSIIEKIDASENLPANCFQIENQSDFESKVQQASTPVIVDFFATWCDPCKTLTPRLETVIQRMKGKVQLAKVDIDVMTDLAMDYRISSVPVLVRMKDGKELNRMVGLQDVAQLEAFIEQEDVLEKDMSSEDEQQTKDGNGPPPPVTKSAQEVAKPATKSASPVAAKLSPPVAMSTSPAAKSAPITPATKS